MADTEKPAGIRRYFVSYSAKIPGGFAFGNTDLSLDRPISNYEDVAAIAAAIRDRYPENQSVTVLNWRRYEEPADG